ncbi:MAG: HD domain-containing protein [bacterium]
MYKDEIIKNMKDYFEEDKKRIDHAIQVTDHAEELISLYIKTSNSHNINREIIIYSAILHDIGIKKSEIKYNSSAPRYQEIEGPPIARKIMESLDIDKFIINEVCEIIGNHHSPSNLDTDNFKILYDADWLVNLPEAFNLEKKTPQEKINIINKLYLTEIGKTRARELFVNALN